MAPNPFTDALPTPSPSGRFRFDYLFLLAPLTAIYLFFELSFNARLLDTISVPGNRDDIDAIEHWGRLISGCAVTLLILKSWFIACEDDNKPWATRIGVSILIWICALALTWYVEDKIIEFYVSSATDVIQPSLVMLLVFVSTIILLTLLWLAICIRYHLGWGWRLLGLAGIVAFAVLGDSTSALRPLYSKHLNEERRLHSSLAVMRLAAQTTDYQLPDFKLSTAEKDLPESKAFHALFPIVGEMFAASTIAAERPKALLALANNELKRTEDQAYANYLSATDQTRHAYWKQYRPLSDRFAKALNSKKFRKNRQQLDDNWNRDIEQALGKVAIPPLLNEDEFVNHRYGLRRTMHCELCSKVRPGMTKKEFSEEIVPQLAQQQVADKEKDYADEQLDHFKNDAEAGRAYWVPFWALMFSMIGALTHICKTFFFSSSLIIRLMHRDDTPSESLLAQNLVGLFAWGTLLLAITMATLMYDKTNAITGKEIYQTRHADLMDKHPLVGRIAHWVINTQHVAYPVSENIRPNWLIYSNHF